MTQITRRAGLFALGGLLLAPAVARAEWLMPVVSPRTFDVLIPFDRVCTVAGDLVLTKIPEIFVDNLIGVPIWKGDRDVSEVVFRNITGEWHGMRATLTKDGHLIRMRAIPASVPLDVDAARQTVRDYAHVRIQNAMDSGRW